MKVRNNNIIVDNIQAAPTSGEAVVTPIISSVAASSSTLPRPRLLVANAATPSAVEAAPRSCEAVVTLTISSVAASSSTLPLPRRLLLVTMLAIFAIAADAVEAVPWSGEAKEWGK